MVALFGLTEGVAPSSCPCPWPCPCPWERDKSANACAMPPLASRLSSSPPTSTMAMVSSARCCGSALMGLPSERRRPISAEHVRVLLLSAFSCVDTAPAPVAGAGADEEEEEEEEEEGEEAPLLAAAE